MTLLPTCIDIRDGIRTNAEISQQLMNRPTKDSEEAYELLYQKLREFKVTRRQLEPERVERLDSLGFSW